MNNERDFEQIAKDWLNAGSDATPTRVIDAVLLAARSTPQERGFGIPWRTQSMSRPAYAATVIAVLAVAAAAAFYAFGRGPSVGPEPSPSSSLQPSQTPTSPPTSTMPPLTGWTTYTSAQYGFAIDHPADWNIQPAERTWDLNLDAPDPLSAGSDRFRSPTGDVLVSAWSVPIDWDQEQRPERVEAWIDMYCQKTGSPSCAGILDGAVPLCVEVRDCHPGLLVGAAPPFDRDVQAFFCCGIYAGQMVVVTVWRMEGDPSLVPYGGGRRLIEAFLSSMCVWPAASRPDPASPEAQSCFREGS